MTGIDVPTMVTCLILVASEVEAPCLRCVESGLRGDGFGLYYLLRILNFNPLPGGFVVLNNSSLLKLDLHVANISLATFMFLLERADISTNICYAAQR